MTDWYVDPYHVQTFAVYVDEKYVGIVKSADVLEANNIAVSKFSVRRDQKLELKPVKREVL